MWGTVWGGMSSVRWIIGFRISGWSLLDLVTTANLCTFPPQVESLAPGHCLGDGTYWQVNREISECLVNTTTVLSP